MITTADIREIVQAGEVIEDYPNDPRGHSCLMLGISEKRFIHVVCSPTDDYLVIITAYIPNHRELEADF